MRPTSPLLCALLGAVSVSLTAEGSAQRPPDSHHLVEVQVRDARYLARLMRLDLDLASCRRPEMGARRVEVLATDADVRKLTRAGFRFRVVTRNLEDHYEAEMRRRSLGRPETLTPPIGQGAMGGHYTLAQIEAILDSFATNHPNLCTQKVSIGKTVENRDIWMVKISDNVGVDENEPEVYYDALHHAREPLSMETTLLFMDELLDGYGTDPEATFIIDERELFFVPCVNPDGYEYNRSTRPNGGGLWRKNRRNNGGSFGVDLNRNYGTGWSAPNGGSSSSGSSNTYRGTRAFSEPEVAAIEAFVKTRNFVQACSCHTYSEILLQPWGYQNGVPANQAEYDALGKRLLASNPMPRGSASGILYIASGTALDHHHAAHGAYSWTPELGTSSEGGFWPAGRDIVDIARRHQPMFRAIAMTAGAKLDITTIQVTELGGNGNGIIEPGESGTVIVTVENQGAAPTATAATVALRAKTAGIPVPTNGASLGQVPKFGSATNNANPMRFFVPATFEDLVIELEITATGDGVGTTRDYRVILAVMRTAVHDDMEVDRGFARSTFGSASTGLWQRGAPQATSSGNQPIQPGTQNTPGGTSCWVTDPRAGSSAGQYDVDGGFTDLLSPVLDLSHMAVAEVGFHRWYAESVGDDPFEFAVSDDGGITFTTVFRSPDRTSGWAPFVFEIPGRPAAKTQFRFRAQDFSPSLVEAAIDDFTVRGVAANGSLTILSSAVRGTTMQFGFQGADGSTSTLLLGTTAVTPFAIPGIGGKLGLDPNRIYRLSSFGIGSSGFASYDLPIPNLQALVGQTFYWQALNIDGSSARLGNRQATTIR